MADAECAKALEWHAVLCRAMFVGRECNERCRNSLAILRRQAKAAKLELCKCQPDEFIEDFPCETIKSNVERLCADEPDTAEGDGAVSTQVYDENDLQEDVDKDEDAKAAASEAANQKSISDLYLVILSSVISMYYKH
jgi:hypothetical protein